MPAGARSERQDRRRQPEDHENLYGGHHGLHGAAELNGEAIEQGEKADDRHRHPEAVVCHRQDTIEKRHGADRVGRDRTRRGDPESRPAIEKSSERTVGLAQKDVFASSRGKQAAQLRVDQRPHEREPAGRQQREQDIERRARVLSHRRRLQEYAGSDDGADHDREGLLETQPPEQIDACHAAPVTATQNAWKNPSPHGTSRALEAAS
jgi:hypothetical protein